MKKLIEFLMLNLIVVIFSSCNIDEEITTALPPQIILDNETGIYTVKQGRVITITPSYESAEKATYSWTMAGKVIGTSPSLSFASDKTDSVGIAWSTLNNVAIA